ncbi:hypothetical protein N9C83_06365 [Opitutales bacterium]|nr:hypothetical protein [Opitutales bacterium]
MKTKVMTNLFMGLLIGGLSSASFAAESKSAESDGIMQLPTFYVYASDSKPEDDTLAVINITWTFQKSLNFQSNLDIITIAAPGNTTKTVLVPSIQTSLVNADFAGG